MLKMAPEINLAGNHAMKNEAGSILLFTQTLRNNYNDEGLIM